MDVYDDDDDDEEENNLELETEDNMAVASVSSDIVRCSARGVELLAQLDAWENEYAELGGFDALCPPLDGTAFYRTICKVNHSCEPNVRVEYTCLPDKGLVAQLVAVRPILPNEELVQSYINQHMSLSKRRVALAEYGFLCRCAKCKREGSSSSSNDA